METTTLIALLALVALVAIAVLSLRSERGRAAVTADMARLAKTADKLSAAQSELAGRMQQAQTSMDQRLDALTKRLGDGLSKQTEKTGETLKGIHERLAVIDTAQKTITSLSEQVVGLQDILSNKQARGAFGEIQLRDLVSAVLPPSVYAWQATLGNNKVADCLILLPNPPGSIAIDAKFPLESYQALRDATDDTARTKAGRAFSTDVLGHVRDIADKYIVPGETAESALMFLPSEAVYAELHGNFRAVVEESFRKRVWIVSPTTLWATLNTVRAILKDVRMREQAGLIQTEVQKMLDDLGRLDTRVGNLQRHFDQATRDIGDIRTSTDKVTRRGARIEEMQLEDEQPARVPSK